MTVRTISEHDPATKGRRAHSHLAALLLVILPAAAGAVGPPSENDRYLDGPVTPRTHRLSTAECSWTSGFEISDLDFNAYALAVYDDGSGTALYVGGAFTTAGGVTVNGIAKWDGTAWSALTGPSGTGTDGRVHALMVYDNGSGTALYAGGAFTTAGGVTVNGIAKWDGTTWSALAGPAATGTNSRVTALAVYDDGNGEALYAGGFFTRAGGVWVGGIAKWDGVTWSALAGPSVTGTSGDVYALAVYDDGSGAALFAGGSFTMAGGVTVNHIARWNGSVWSELTGAYGSMGANNTIYALAVYDDGSGEALYTGGSFTMAGGVTANHIARWSGTTWWSALPGPAATGTSGDVYALTVHDDGSGQALFAGGSFTTAGGVPVNHIARWNGSAWSALTGPATTGADLWVATLAVYDDGGGETLYAGGAFTTTGGVMVNHIARWDGSAWSPLTSPTATATDYSITVLAVYDDGSGEALYAGGAFTTAGGLPVNHIARWDGSAWSALTGPADTGTTDTVYALAVHDDGSGEALYAGGAFATAGGVPVNYIAKWNGTAWSALTGPAGTGTSGLVYALAVYDDGSGEALYAGGYFMTAGGIPANGIAKWDGTAWSALAGPSGTGTSHTVYALAVYDDGSGKALYAGGRFATAGGVSVYGISRWEGTVWSALTGPAGTGLSGSVHALTVYNDGSGEALFAGGWFATAGGVSVNGIARWDGTAWSALTGPAGIGTDSWVFALAVYEYGSDESLYAGGNFTAAGGMGSSHIAKWSCPPIFVDGFESGDTQRWSYTVP